MMPPEPTNFIKLSAEETLEREFLPLRSRLLDIAAGLDRIDRAKEGLPNDSDRENQIRKIERAVQILIETESSDRAERIQNLFSREYDSEWIANWIASNRERVSRESTPSVNSEEEA